MTTLTMKKSILYTTCLFSSVNTIVNKERKTFYFGYLSISSDCQYRCSRFSLLEIRFQHCILQIVRSVLPFGNNLIIACLLILSSLFASGRFSSHIISVLRFSCPFISFQILETALRLLFNQFSLPASVESPAFPSSAVGGKFCLKCFSDPRHFTFNGVLVIVLSGERCFVILSYNTSEVFDHRCLIWLGLDRVLE